mgnify:CR=1 FL=1
MKTIEIGLLGKHGLAMLVGVAMLVILVGTGGNIWFGRTAGQIARDQFNAEQLVVARNVRYWVERQMAALGKELELLAKKAENGASDPRTLQPLLQPAFERVVGLGVDRIELVDPRRREKYTYYPFRLNPERSPLSPDDEAPEVAGLSSAAGSSRIRIIETLPAGSDIQLTLSMELTNLSPARLAFQVNLSWFLAPFLKHIRSGKDGYAWLLDDQGRFLFHPYTAFTGRSAFDARHQRDPGISLQRIDTIQKEGMLKGLEGTGAYLSAWHLGITGPMEKLIAYTPITISESPLRKWSVAVVAPMHEIGPALARIHRLQLFLQAMVLLVVFSAAAVVYFFRLRWHQRLEECEAIRSQALKL